MIDKDLQIGFYGFFKFAIFPQLVGFTFLIIDKLI